MEKQEQQAQQTQKALKPKTYKITEETANQLKALKPEGITETEFFEDLLNVYKAKAEILSKAEQWYKAQEQAEQERKQKAEDEKAKQQTEQEKQTQQEEPETAK